MIKEAKDLSGNELLNFLEFHKKYDEVSYAKATSKDDELSILLEEIDSNDYMLVYKIKNKFVGIVCMSEYINLADNDYKDGVMYLQNLYVEEEYRNQKIATKLLKKAINIAKKRGKTKIISSYMESNNISSKWHEKNEFKPISKEIFVERNI